MSILKVKFKALNYSYSNTTFTIDIECPDFEVKESNIGNYLSQEVMDKIAIDSQISIKDQQEEWLNDFDKSDIMSEKELNTIINWEILDKEIAIYNKEDPYKELKDVLLLIWPKEEDSEKIIDFLVIYREMEPFIKYMKLQKRIDIIMKVYTITLSGQIAFSDKLSKIYKGEGELSKRQQEKYNERLPYGKRSTSIYKQGPEEYFEKNTRDNKEDINN